MSPAEHDYNTTVSVYWTDDRVILEILTGRVGSVRVTQDPVVVFEHTNVSPAMLGNAVEYCFRTARLVEDEAERFRVGKSTYKTVKKLAGARSDTDFTQRVRTVSLSTQAGPDELHIVRNIRKVGDPAYRGALVPDLVTQRTESTDLLSKHEELGSLVLEVLNQPETQG